MQIIGYARVSSREQSENSHALEQQIERLKAAGVGDIRFDVDSGSKDKRLAFNEVMNLVRSRAINEVVVTRLDRLTRSLPTLRKALDTFRESGVNLRALDDSVDMRTAAGKFHLNMLGALAEMEVDRLSERVKHGWQHLRDRKVAMHPPFGYCKIDDSHHLDHQPFLCLLDTHQERSKAQIAREIIEAFLSQKSLRLALRVINERYGIRNFSSAQKGRVARELFRFSPAGLSTWLTNPVLRGHLCYLRSRDGQRRKSTDWEIHYNTHPEQRLISDEEYRAIEAIISHNARVKGYGSTALKHPLSGLVYCGECRAACYSCSGNRGKSPGYNYYFQCKNWRDRSCSNKQMIRMEVVEEAVIAALVKRADAIATLAQSPEDTPEPPELQQLKSQLEGLERLGYNPVLDEAKRQLQCQIQNFKEKLKSQTQQQEATRDSLLWAFGETELWKNLGDEDKKRAYRMFVERVTIKSGQVISVELRV